MGPGELARLRVRVQAQGGYVPIPGDILLLEVDFQARADALGLVIGWEYKDQDNKWPTPRARVKVYNLKTHIKEHYTLTFTQYKSYIHTRMLEEWEC